MTSHKWTTADIPPQAGRLAIVTGGTSGIGYETALALAKAGARVIIASRNDKRGADAIASIRRAHKRAAVEFRLLDTARLSSVRKFAKDWQREQRRIDILVLNAGIAAVPNREETEDGFERQLATNYLGHFALTGLLLPHIEPSAQSRIVAVASIAHRHARIHFDDLQLKNYHSGKAYNRSKLAMLIFGLELDRRLRQGRASAAASRQGDLPRRRSVRGDGRAADPLCRDIAGGARRRLLRSGRASRDKGLSQRS
jgi:NAD(P)-dependent dehydrogenase (short-subunit alcohol dehydrogenase family)